MERGAHPQTRLGHDVGVNHRRIDVLVPEQFQNGANVVAVLQKVRAEQMPERAASDALADPRHVSGLLG